MGFTMHILMTLGAHYFKTTTTGITSVYHRIDNMSDLFAVKERLQFLRLQLEKNIFRINSKFYLSVNLPHNFFNNNLKL